MVISKSIKKQGSLLVRIAVQCYQKIWANNCTFKVGNDSDQRFCRKQGNQESCQTISSPSKAFKLFNILFWSPLFTLIIVTVGD